MIIDVAVSADSRTWSKEVARELRRIWKVQTRVVPVVIGALGTITTRHKDFLAEMGIHVSFETIQKASLLGTAHILRKETMLDRMDLL